MVRILLIVAICPITLLQLTIPILGQMSKTDVIRGIAGSLLSPIEEKELNFLFKGTTDEYYAIQGRSFYQNAVRYYNNRYYDLALANINNSLEYCKQFELFNKFIITELYTKKHYPKLIIKVCDSYRAW